MILAIFTRTAQTGKDKWEDVEVIIAIEPSHTVQNILDYVHAHHNWILGSPQEAPKEAFFQIKVAEEIKTIQS